MRRPGWDLSVQGRLGQAQPASHGANQGLNARILPGEYGTILTPFPHLLHRNVVKAARCREARGYRLLPILHLASPGRQLTLRQPQPAFSADRSSPGGSVPRSRTHSRSGPSGNFSDRPVRR
jgi:hypothetical protein